MCIKPKYDLKNDPKFANKVKKLEGNKYAKILKTPLRIEISQEYYYVACIGLNDSYLIVQPLFDSEQFCGFKAYWTKDGFRDPTVHHAHVASSVLNWMMMVSDENSFIKKKHLDVKIVATSIEACSRILGQAEIRKAGAVFPFCHIQGASRYDIVNPYYTK